MTRGEIHDESLRWHAFLASLDSWVLDGALTEAQRDAFFSIWDAATTLSPTMRRPVIDVRDGLLGASWAFSDLPGHVFSLELGRNGEVDWFCGDSATRAGAGSERVAG